MVPEAEEGVVSATSAARYRARFHHGLLVARIAVAAALVGLARYPFATFLRTSPETINHLDTRDSMLQESASRML